MIKLCCNDKKWVEFYSMYIKIKQNFLIDSKLLILYIKNFSSLLFLIQTNKAI